jgi:hypothetical protein
MDKQHRHARTAIVLAIACAPFIGCNTDKLAKSVDNINGDNVEATTKDLAKQCGLECPALGIADGNAAISGVTSVDAFFGAVIDFKTSANTVSTNLEAQLDAIRGDFELAADADVAAEIRARSEQFIDGSLVLETEPEHCVTDVQAVVKATAACDEKVDPGETACECRGKCVARASEKTECSTSEQVTCSVNAPSIDCSGMCQGSCSAQLTTAAACEGTCHGTCSGECSAYVTNANGDFVCNGTCAGKCKGSCTTELSAGAECSGKCEGQCVLTGGSADCSTAVTTECTSMASASVMCKGRCEGEVQPPKAKAECEASAQAHAQVHVECTPPHLALHYKLRAVASADVEAQARFVASLTRLEKRMPVLLAAHARATHVLGGGDTLVSAAKTAVKTSFSDAKSGKISVKEAIGLGCALTELDDVGSVVSESSDRLHADLDACTSLETSLGMQG